MKKKQKEKSVAEILRDQSLLKQDVYDVAREVFGQFKELLEERIVEFRKEIPDERVRLKFEDKGAFEAYAFVGSDVLVFNMHTNVFRFPDESAAWKTSYVQKDQSRAYCGVINVYNFLADSFLQGRMHDPGYLLARIFVNKEKHFVIEGVGKLGFLYRDFVNGEINDEVKKEVLNTVVQHAAEFDLLMPPYDLVSQVNVMQIQAVSSALQMKTGKRLGFRFKAEGSEIN